MTNNLFNSKFFHDPISIHDMNSEQLKKMLKLMLIIRKTEQHLALARKKALIGGPVHPYHKNNLSNVGYQIGSCHNAEHSSNHIISLAIPQKKNT